MVLLGEEEACFLKSFTVESVGVLEDLTYRVHVYVLG